MSDQRPDTPAPTVLRTPREWREVLTPFEFAVLREGATERPFTGEYDRTFEAGTYACKACGAELFTSEQKFASHCGWPSFYAPSDEERITYIRDDSLPGRPRIEVRCSACQSHLGHVFEGEGYDTPTDLRYCINSICLVHTPNS
ncbi:peptide-methionine (R)-S-oxide reductase MsrB [Propioniciclava soli]|uniref:peptide-methionine (R)-S-oxide reductase n=1 Tax=Propioniciclava soli TaxID=2775081 RepID=A0ABZ3CEU8_9ACTN